MPYTIRIERDDCIGAATCIDCAPNVFRLDDEDIAEVTNPTGDPDESVAAAAQDCPMQCIYLIDAKTGEQVYP